MAVTGAGGFIGSHVVRRLLASGAAPAALVAPPGAPCTEMPAGVRGCYGAIDDPAVVREVVEGADVVVHLAGPASVAGSFPDPRGCVRAHVMGTATVLDACGRAGVRRVVYVSSAEVYGAAAGAGRTPESTPLEPCSPYAASKVGAEALVRAHVADGPASAVVLRPVSVYGPGARRDSLVPTLLSQALAAPAVELFDPHVVRDFCFVDDLVDAVQRACVAELASPYAVLNIGTGVGTSPLELAAVAAHLVGREVPVRSRGGSDRPPGSDVRHLVVDPGRAAQAIGWRPLTDLETGLARTLDSLQWEETACAS
jgi:UDP-glucose 4-epimerase